MPLFFAAAFLGVVRGVARRDSRTLVAWALAIAGVALHLVGRM